MISIHKEKSVKTTCQIAAEKSNKNTSSSIANFSELQKAKKIENAKRRVYATADGLNW